jgi:hypothetical protein
MMKTMTFIFIEDGHASASVITAETEYECSEKYFIKYPERKGDSRLHVKRGDQMPTFKIEQR